MLKIKYNYLITFISSLPSAIIVFLPLKFAMIFQKNILALLYSCCLQMFTPIFIFVICMVGVEALALMCSKSVFLVIYNRLSKKQYNKIISSEEYQNVLKDIEQLSLEVNLENKNVTTKFLERKNASREVDVCRSEIISVRSLINFTVSMVEPVENSLQLLRVRKIEDIFDLSSNRGENNE